MIENNRASCIIKTSAEIGKELKLTKYAIFCDSIRHSDCGVQAQEEMSLALSTPIEELHRKQQGHLHGYWKNCSINIEGDEELDQALAFNMYQLNQSVSKDAFGNIAPKGLSGDGYEGQYFWIRRCILSPTSP